jgi:aminocarboxymuconate-semialdehyde decarboxylase
VMLGTDHPFELGDRTPIGTVTALALDALKTRAILWENAVRLLKIA